MTEPTQTCQLCGRRVIVRPDGRGFPPKIAANKLKKICQANGCPSEPKYQAGMDDYVSALMRLADLGFWGNVEPTDN